VRACAREGAGVHTGIDDWINARVWKWETSANVKLLKLHGSIDWRWDEPATGDGHMPMQQVVRTGEPVEDERQPVVLFGQRNKLREEGPFLSLLAEFERALNKASRLIAIGYSFHDAHINTVITRWTRGDKARTILGVDPGFPSPAQLRALSPSDFRTKMWEHLRSTGHDDPDMPQRLELWPLKTRVALTRMETT
jgi:hypothetical protein